MAHIICNRRRFLGGLAAGLMATPFLPRFAGAGGVGPIPKRIVFVFTPNGTIKENWADWAGQGGSITERSIDEVELGPILQPFAARRQSILALRGVNMESCYDGTIPKDHWPDHMNHLTGIQLTPGPDRTGSIAGISIDQHIAQRWQAESAATFASVQLGVRVGKPNGFLPPQRVVSARGPGDALLPQEDPYEVFTSMFAGIGLDDAQAAALRAKRGRVLDAVTAELRSAECQLGGDDRIKLHKHLEAIVALEESLDVEVGACTLPQIDDIDHRDDAKLGQLIDQQLGNLHALLACGLTRVATLQLGSGDITHGHLGHSEAHHYYSHGELNGVPASEWKTAQTQIDEYYAQKIASFLDMLAATPEEDGSTLFDHTLVVWCHEHSTGSHNRRDMPYVLAGGSQCGIEMGRVIHAGGDTTHKDVTVNDLWMSVANRMGVDTPTFGDPSHVHGPLPFL